MYVDTRAASRELLTLSEIHIPVNIIQDVTSSSIGIHNIRTVTCLSLTSSSFCMILSSSTRSRTSYVSSHFTNIPSTHSSATPTSSPTSLFANCHSRSTPLRKSSSHPLHFHVPTAAMSPPPHLELYPYLAHHPQPSSVQSTTQIKRRPTIQHILPSHISSPKHHRDMESHPRPSGLAPLHASHCATPPHPCRLHPGHRWVRGSPCGPRPLRP
jgi:hypothetical protein